eukprot:TRINITY_DN97_c0_g1_i6.p1 TRINITY_DN97_c0_g1~~TRINITY_DN97_c0_g1_i6.p1  ORF type:complete len:542 (+),score=204.72 TRINITY_DN97_c0_g1_i6:60-1685(+)
MMKALALACAVSTVGAVVFKEHRIKSWDGTELSANSYEPTDITSPLPLVIMGNSWGMPDIEYLWPSRELAEKNYIAVEYEARGFYTSGGKIGTASPEDVADHSSVVTWALEKWGDKINASAIAAGGISYGAGTALLVTANDSRITTCFAMSGWASLKDALWWNWAPSLFWSNFLTEAGAATGREPEELHTMVDNVLNHKNVNETVAWANVRSPITYLDQLNARKVPVFISNQFEDNMLHSNFQVDLWKKIEGPKRLILGQGTHAEADGTGLVPVGGSYIWTSTFDWLDRFLKGEQNGADQAPLVEVSLSDHHDPLIPGKPVYTRSKYSSWPPVLASEKYAVAQYSLQSFTATGDKHGKLVPKAQTVAASYDVLKYTNSTKMSTGIPVVGPAIRPLHIKTIDLEKLDSEYELAFLTEPVSEKTRVCGNFNVTGLKATALMPNFQVMGYLWSVKAKNFWGVHKAALLTHGPLNVYDSIASQPQTLQPLTFHAACRDLKKGDSLMLGINLHDSLYKGANDSPQLSVRLDYTADTVLNVETVAVQ